MGSVGLIFKRRVRLGVNASAESLPVGAIELDASIQENHRSANAVTSFPVEQGVNISDHVRKEPDSVTIRGIVTDHPLIWGGGGFVKRSIQAYQKVLRMMDDAELISVVTTIRQYDNMIIQSNDTPRNSSLGNAVEFNLTLREIKTVQVLETQGTVNKGTQVGTAVT